MDEAELEWVLIPLEICEDAEEAERTWRRWQEWARRVPGAEVRVARIELPGGKTLFVVGTQTRGLERLQPEGFGELDGETLPTAEQLQRMFQDFFVRPPRPRPSSFPPGRWTD